MFVRTTHPTRLKSTNVAASTNPCRRKKDNTLPDDDFVQNPNFRLQKYLEKPKSYNYTAVYDAIVDIVKNSSLYTYTIIKLPLLVPHQHSKLHVYQFI